MHTMRLDSIDYELLSEVYDLNQLHFSIVKENVIRNHYYNTTGEVDVLTEGFTDIISKIGDFFKTMIEKIKKFFKKVLMFVESCFMDIDKFVKKYKDELKSINIKPYEFHGYNFTMHEPPDMSEFEKIVSSYNSDISEVSKLKKGDILKQQNDYLIDSNLDGIRGKILGSNNKITENDFHEEVRKYYRDGDLDEITITIDNTYYHKVLDSIPKLVTDKKEAEKTRDKLIILLEKTQRFFNTNAAVVYKDSQQSIRTRKIDTSEYTFRTKEEEFQAYSEKNISNVEAFLKFKYNQVNKISSMINLVASERANAYKDQVKMYRSIIKSALSKPEEDDDKKDKED